MKLVVQDLAEEHVKTHHDDDVRENIDGYGYLAKDSFTAGFNACQNLLSEEIEKWKKKAEKRTELLENLDESFNKLRDALIKSKSMYWKCHNDFCAWVDEVLK